MTRSVEQRILEAVEVYSPQRLDRIKPRRRQVFVARGCVLDDDV
jgi:hypothetical protein